MIDIEKNDPVTHPSHYTDGIEVMDYIESKGWGEGFCRGNAVKYISRAGKKDPDKEIEDLKKASWYLERDIQRLEKERLLNQSLTGQITIDGRYALLGL